MHRYTTVVVLVTKERKLKQGWGCIQKFCKGRGEGGGGGGGELGVFKKEGGASSFRGSSGRQCFQISLVILRGRD